MTPTLGDLVGQLDEPTRRAVHVWWREHGAPSMNALEPAVVTLVAGYLVDLAAMPAIPRHAVLHVCGEPVWDGIGRSRVQYERLVIPGDSCPSCGWSFRLPLHNRAATARFVLAVLGSDAPGYLRDVARRCDVVLRTKKEADDAA